jgi:lipopolysaccharide export system permease protein
MSSMFKVFYTSVLKELFVAFLLSLGFMNAILMMEDLLKLSRTLSGIGTSLPDMAVIILYIQPQLLFITIPISLLLSVLLVYGRMNMDNEIVILRISGMDFKKISIPVFVLGIICFFSSIAVSFSIGPKSSILLKEKITHIIATRASQAIEAGTFYTSFKDVVLLVKGKKPDNVLDSIFIYDNRVKDEPRVLMAREAQLFTTDDLQTGMYMKDGYMNLSRGKTITELFFDSYNMTLDLHAESQTPKKSDLTPMQLITHAREAKRDKDRTALYLELHRRISLPVVCLLLVLFAPPLAMIAGKSGKLGGLAFGLLVFAGYYMVLIYFENLVKAEKLSHYTGAWIPTLLLGVCAVILFRKENAR